MWNGSIGRSMASKERSIGSPTRSGSLVGAAEPKGPQGPAGASDVTYLGERDDATAYVCRPPRRALDLEHDRHYFQAERLEATGQ